MTQRPPRVVRPLLGACMFMTMSQPPGRSPVTLNGAQLRAAASQGLQLLPSR